MWVRTYLYGLNCVPQIHMLKLTPNVTWGFVGWYWGLVGFWSNRMGT